MSEIQTDGAAINWRNLRVWQDSKPVLKADGSPETLGEMVDRNDTSIRDMSFCSNGSLRSWPYAGIAAPGEPVGRYSPRRPVIWEGLAQAVCSQNADVYGTAE